jgi:four helix bundle protein
MKSVEDLDVFKLAHELVLETYAVTKSFPKYETFSLVAQMRRAATSIGMNLVEGIPAFRRNSSRIGPKSAISFFSPGTWVISPMKPT